MPTRLPCLLTVPGRWRLPGSLALAELQPRAMARIRQLLALRELVRVHDRLVIFGGTYGANSADRPRTYRNRSYQSRSRHKRSDNQGANLDSNNGTERLRWNPRLHCGGRRASSRQSSLPLIDRRLSLASSRQRFASSETKKPPPRDGGGPRRTTTVKARVPKRKGPITRVSNGSHAADRTKTLVRQPRIARQNKPQLVTAGNAKGPPKRAFLVSGGCCSNRRGRRPIHRCGYCGCRPHSCFHHGCAAAGRCRS
ncbi:hypothetical protein ABIB57_004314 [Devosia sp. UYZn731]